MKKKKWEKMIHFCKKYFSKDILEQISKDLIKITKEEKK